MPDKSKLADLIDAVKADYEGISNEDLMDMIEGEVYGDAEGEGEEGDMSEYEDEEDMSEYDLPDFPEEEEEEMPRKKKKKFDPSMM